METLADLPGVLEEAYETTVEGRTAIVNVLMDEDGIASRLTVA